MGIFEGIQQDQRFNDLDYEQKKQVLSLALEEDLKADPRYSQADPEAVTKERDSYVDSYLQDLESPKTTIGGLASSLGTGLAEGLTTELPSMAGSAMEFVGSYLPDSTDPYIEDVGKDLKDWSEEQRQKLYGEQPKRSGLENIVYEGSKMLAPSIIPGGIMTSGMRILTKVGKLVEASKAARLIGDIAKAESLMLKANKTASMANKIGASGAAGLFGLSQAQQTVDSSEQEAKRLESQGKPEEAAKVREAGKGWAPLATGGIEAVGEYFGTKYLGKLFRLDEAEVVKRGAKNLVMDFIKTLGVENVTEIGQAYGQATVEKGTGIRPEANPLKEALDVIGPTTFMTLLTGGMGGAANVIRPTQDVPGITPPPEPLDTAKVLGALEAALYEGTVTIDEARAASQGLMAQGMPSDQLEAVFQRFEQGPSQSEAITQAREQAAQQGGDLLDQVGSSAQAQANHISRVSSLRERTRLAGPGIPIEGTPVKAEDKYKITPRGPFWERRMDQATERLGGKVQPEEAPLIEQPIPTMGRATPMDRLRKTMMGVKGRVKDEPTEPGKQKEAREVAKVEKPVAKGKEPWEMTREEFKQSQKPPGDNFKSYAENIAKHRIHGDEKVMGQATGNMLADKVEAQADTIRKAEIKAALSRGEPVSPEVLADYPELKEKAQPPTPRQKREERRTQAKAEAEKPLATFDKGTYKVHAIKDNTAKPGERDNSKWRVEVDEDASLELNAAVGEVEAGAKGERTRIPDPNGPGYEWVGIPSTYPDWMRDKNWNKIQVLKALNLAMEGKKLGSEQVKIVENALDFMAEWRKIEEAKQELQNDGFTSEKIGRIQGDGEKDASKEVEGRQSGRSSPIDEDGFNWATGRYETEPGEVKEQLGLFGPKKKKPFSLAPEEPTPWEKVEKLKKEGFLAKKEREAGKKPVFRGDKPLPSATYRKQGNLFGVGKNENLTLQFNEQEEVKPEGKSGGISRNQRVYYATTGSIEAQARTLSSDRRTANSEIATLIDPLIGGQPGENMVAVISDKDGTILEVFKYTKGTKSAASVSPNEIAGHILDIPNASRACIVHNHPAGSSLPSAEDRAITKAIANLLKAKDIPLNSIILGDGIYSDISDDYSIAGPVIPSSQLEYSVPVIERKYLIKDASLKDADMLTDPELAIEYHKEKHEGQDGILLLSANSKPVAFIPFEKGKTAQETTRELLVLQDSSNASSAVIFADDMESAGRTEYINALMATSLGDLSFLDVISKGKSYRQGPNILPGIRAEGMEEGRRFGTIMSKDIRLMAASTETPGPGISFQRTKLIVNSLLPKIKGVSDISIKVVRSLDEVPPETLANAQVDLSRIWVNGKPATFNKETGKIEFVKGDKEGRLAVSGIHAFGPDGKPLVYIIAEAVPSATAVRSTLMEEAYHEGFDRVMGTEMDSFLDKLWKESEADILPIAEEYGIDTSEAVGQRSAANEWFAKQIRDDTLSVRIWNRFIRLIREFWKRIDPNLTLTHDEIKDMVRRVVAGKEQAQGQATGVNEFSQAPGLSMAAAKKKITDNPAFRRWFGKSKVTDESGEPLVVYHGTGDDFNIFRLGTGRGYGLAYFSDSTDAASRYAIADGIDLNYSIEETIDMSQSKQGDRKPSVMPVYLKMERPLDLRKVTYDDIVKTLGEDLILSELEHWSLSSWLKFDEYEGSLSDFLYDQDMSEAFAGEDTASLKGNEEALFLFSTGLIHDFIKKGGYDGVILNDAESGGVTYMITPTGKSTQIKSIFNRGTFDPENPDIRMQARRQAEKWHSQMVKHLEAKLPATGNPEQMAKTIEAWAKKGDIKEEELAWSGLTDWLKDQDGKVSKQEILDWLAENHVQIQEVEKGKFSPKLPEGWTMQPEGDSGWVIRDTRGAKHGQGETERDAMRSAGFIADVNRQMTKFSQYQIPGGQNYRELLLTLPGKTEAQILRDEAERRGYGDKISEWPDQEFAQRYRDTVTLNKTADSEQYRSSHWDEPNVLAHVRFNERTGPNGERVLFIEEVQSDWHQKGRKEGYKGKELNVPAGYIVKEKTIDGQKLYALGKEGAQEVDAYTGYYPNLENAIREITNQFPSADRPPNAPFKESRKWGLLAIKRMVRYAAENGFDTIAWTQGDVQVQRYKEALQSAVDKIEWTKTQGGIQLVGYKDGSQVVDTVEKENAISDAIGKSMGDAIIESPEQSGTFEGEDITISDTGMAGFYDTILPNSVNKFFGKKAWGNAKVGEITLEVRNIDGERLPSGAFGSFKKVHSLPVTPEMRGKALEEGMPLFQVEAFHGSPYAFDKFRSDKIGTGEGAQAFGHGLYFTDMENIARHYAEASDANYGILWKDFKARFPEAANAFAEDISNASIRSLKMSGHIFGIELEHFYKSGGTYTKFINEDTIKLLNKAAEDGYMFPKENRNLYKVTLHKGKDPSQYTWLDWDEKVLDKNYEPIIKQAEKDLTAGNAQMDEMLMELRNSREYPVTGDQLYGRISNVIEGKFGRNDREASLFLLRAGIDGIRYPAGSLSGADTGAKNYVVFDPEAVTIEERISFDAKQRPPEEYNLAEDPKTKALLEKLQRLYTKRGEISPKKTARLIDKYETLIQTLKDDKKDIYVKQKALEEHIKKNLPGSERFRVLAHIKKIAKPITEAGRQRMLERAIVKVEEAHQRYEKRRLIAKVDKLLLSKKPRRTVRGVRDNRRMDAEANRLVDEVRKARKMSQGEASEQMFDILDKMDRGIKVSTLSSEEARKLKELTRKDSLSDQEQQQLEELQEKEASDQLERFAIVSTFSGLENKTIPELSKALNVLSSIISKGRTKWQEKENVRRNKMNGLRVQFVKESTGGKGLKSTIQERAESQKGFWKSIVEGVRSFDDMSQSWEMMLDKLARLDKESEALKSPSTEHYRKLVFNATIGEHSGMAAHQELFARKMEEIFGKKGLAKKLRVNTQIEKKTGVTIGTKHGRVETPLSQNIAYNMWQKFQQPSLQEEMQAQGYDSETLRGLEEFLDPKVKKWAEWQINEFYPMYREGINDIHKEILYVDMANIEGYSPTSRIYMNETVDDVLLRESGLMSSVWASAIKARVENSRDFNFLDGDSVLLKHIVEMEHFKAWAIPMREMRSVLGSEMAQRAIKQYHGATANRVMQNFINRFATGGQERALTLNLMDKLRANFVTSVIGANPVVFLKQLSSIPAYMMEIPIVDFGLGTAYALSHPMKVYKTLMQSEAMKARYKVGWERDIMLQMRRATVRGVSSKKQTLADTLMLSTKLGDKFAIMTGGWSVYSYHLERLKKNGMNDTDAHKEALYQFDIATKRSQQAGDVMDISFLQGYGGSLGKWFTMFMTAPLSYYRNSSAAFRNMAADRKGDNLKRLVISWVTLQMLFQYVASGFEWDDEKMLRAALVGPLNGLFIVRDITDSLMGALIEGRPSYWAVGMPPPLTTGAPLISGTLHLRKWIEEDFDTEEFLKMANDLAKAAGQVSGIPYGPVSRIAGGISAAVTGETEYPVRRSLGYSERALENDEE